MARFRCRACGEEGTFVYTGGHACPRCGSRDVQLAGAATAALFIAGFRWGLYLLAGIPLALAVAVGLMVPAISQDGAAHWRPRPLRDFTLAILNIVRGR